jgi:hypothetical protein
MITHEVQKSTQILMIVYDELLTYSCAFFTIGGSFIIEGNVMIGDGLERTMLGC